MFENNERRANEVIGNPANWAGHADGEDTAILGAGGAEHDPDALLATELLKKADEEKEKGSDLLAN